MAEGKTDHSLSTSETNNEMNSYLSVKNPLYDDIEEVKETELKDVVEDISAESSKLSPGNYVRYLCWGLLTIVTKKCIVDIHFSGLYKYGRGKNGS